MGKKVPVLAIPALLGAESAGGAEHDALVPASHTRREIPLSVTATLTVPISATGRGHTVLPKPVTMYLSVATPQIIYSEK